MESSHLLFLIFIIFSIVHSHSSDFEIERNSLISFYKSTNGDNWINNTNWLSDKPLDMWHGISLNELGYVKSVALSSNNLIGRLNEELGNLIQLATLNLGYNYLTGSIPSTFGNLVNLEYITFDSNSFEGPLNFNSSDLKEVHCSSNYFTGSVLSTSLFSQYLKYYTIESNYFSGSIPSIENYTALILFNIQINNIEGILPELPENLVYFVVSENHFSGSVTIEWDKYLYLKQFYVSSNFLTGTIANINSRSLDKFNLNVNLFTGGVPTFTNINSLSLIGITSNHFHGSLPDEFDTSCELSYYYFEYNYLVGSIPSNLGNCGLSLVGIEGRSNLFTGTIPDKFRNLNRLDSLTLSDNMLSGTLSNAVFNNLKLLLYFEISYNKFDKSLPSALSNMRFLFSLMLGHNDFTGTMPKIASTLIIEIELSNNVLTGTIPIFYTSISFLTAEDNHFDGAINIDRSFVYLSSYQVGNNYLTGPIPSEISIISSLNSLYIYSNYLTGSFPSELCNLSNLKLLNINDLDMCVPSCLTRAAYSVSSYDFIRCQNEQDLALCSMIQQTDVYDKLSSSVEYVTEVYESSHPMNVLDNSSYFNLINISGANKYVLTFDIWTDFDSEDFLQICADSECNTIIISYSITDVPGINGNDPLELLYPYFYIIFRTAYVSTYFQYWGYLVTVNAYFPLIGWSCTQPPIISQSYDDEILSKYNLTLSNSYAVDICGNINNWRGIECTFVSITSLSLESFGISGTIPSSLSLLTAIDQLYFSYNSFSGSLPESIGNLTNLQILDLSNNKLSHEIPSELGKLTKLQYLYLQSNDLNGTIPESLAFLNESLQLMTLSANQLGGKLTNDLCSISNASIDVSGNNLLCYEECWDSVNGKSLKSGDLSICAPTSYPTSQPSSPTFKPTSNVNKSNNIIQFIYILASILLIILFLLVCLFANSKERKLRTYRKNALVKLPVHRYILEKKSSNEILQILKYASTTMAIEDYDGNNVIDLALENKLSNDIITEILKLLLSMQSDEHALSHDFKYAWVRVIQSDIYIDSVKHILEVYYTLSRELSDCLDENGRSAVNIASPLCRQAIKESLYFLRRYDFGTNIYPTHVSDTSIIYMAVDTQNIDENKKSVAIKFISNKVSYMNEIRSRKELSTDSDSIIPILASFDASKHSNYDFEIRRRKLDKYMYCIVMPAGEKNLGNIIATERIAGKDWTQLKVITTQLVLSVNQLHSKQYIHGDIKPLNVIRLGNEIKLIDLDACAKVGSDNYGSKYSHAYVPPEFIYRGDNGYLMNIQSLRADYSQDSWSLGMLLYELYTGMSFFLKDYDDDIDMESLELLYDFDDDMKQKKLSKISDRFARNLVSLLLDKDPNKRLSMSRILEHPFISGKSAVRLEGEEAEYDMFISYRVSSDLQHAVKMYDILTEEGFRVWFDKTSLLPGKNWEEGFSDGLVKSRVLVPIISRNSLNHPTNPRSNITLLSEDSPCDNVLLEYALALELKERGLITQIYPVLIGDYDIERKEYIDYFLSGCYPKNMKNVVVKSVDENVRSHLNRLGLGSRLTDNDGVKNIIESIFKSQGYFVKGSKEKSLLSIIKDIKLMKSSTIYTQVEK